MKRSFTYLIFLHVLFLLCIFGCARNQGIKEQKKSSSTVQTMVYRGKIIQKLNRSRIIKIQVTEDNHLKIIEIPFDQQTRGLEYAIKGKQVLLTCTASGGKSKAVSLESGGPEYADGVSAMTIQELHKMIITKKDFTLVDTRTRREYERSHLPGAISGPACAGNGYQAFMSADKDLPLIFYCGWPDCNRSLTASASAAHAGYKKVRVLDKGLTGWAGAGYATIVDDAFIQKGNPILLDLRPARKDTVARIPGSISMPLPALTDRIKEIPPDALIVVYSARARDSRKALVALREAGYTDTAMVQGNFNGWQRRGNRIISGPIVTSIHWSRRQTRGEIIPAEFKAAQKGKNNAVILDVRTDKEVALGKIANSIHIPLAELYKRMNDLPKDKIIYCAAGPRADLASRELKRNGYRSLYLSAELDCDGKKCAIRE